MRTYFYTIILSVLALFTGFSGFGQVADTGDSLMQEARKYPGERGFDLYIKACDYFINNSPKKAAQASLMARKIASDMGSEEKEMKAQVFAGRANANMGNYGMAFNHLNNAIIYYSKEKRPRELAEVYLYTALAFMDQGQYKQSLSNSQESFTTFQALDDKKGMASALNTIGATYYHLKEYDLAIKNYEQALNYRTLIDDKNGIAVCLNNIANVYSDRAQYDKSIEYLKRALEIKTVIGNKKSIAKTLHNIGSTYFEMSDYNTASQYFLDALEMKKAAGDKNGMITSLANLGGVTSRQGKPEKSIEYYTRAYNLASEIGASGSMKDICQALGKLYFDKGDLAKAYQFNHQYAEIQDSLFSEQMAESMAEMQAKFDVERAERDAEQERQNAVQERERRDADNFRSKIIIVAAVLVLLIISVLAFFLLRQSMARKQINERLKFQQHETEKKNNALQGAYRVIEEKNKDITDSIRYAKRIQEAILPEQQFRAIFGNTAFVFYRPKDIVSGDFYWMEEQGDDLFVAAVDCTGHGVPGAFMSIVCNNLLVQTLHENNLTRPGDILSEVSRRLERSLHKKADEQKVQDGMDIALCRINRKTMEVQYAGAFNPMYIARGGTILETPADKIPVGALHPEHTSYQTHTIPLLPGDCIYLFTDGFADQFGGPQNKKFKRSHFKTLLARVSASGMDEQRRTIVSAFEQWQGVNEQVDDVLVMGIRI